MIRIAVLAVAACIAAGCAAFGERVADRLYSDLDTPIDSETAITTMSYPPSADIRAVFGGKGEGVDCSIPAILEKLMFERLDALDSSVSLQFRQGCVYHDFCYRHGYATYGYTQADCDFALLQQSFRTCMQIYGTGFLATNDGAGRSRTEVCQKRAREVLLGVRIGGQSSFKARGSSTYFEFDPMPARAEDYAVARLARVNPGNAPHVDGETLVATPTVFRFKRGRVLRRQLMWSAINRIGDADLRDDEGAAFPQYATPTPPLVARISRDDWFIWLTRGSAYTTGFDVLATPARAWFSHSPLRRLPCPVTGAGNECDFDASVTRLARTWQSDEAALRFFTFSHRFADHTVSKPRAEPRTVGLHHWSLDVAQIDGGREERPTVVISKVTDISRNRYRFLQSDLVVGDFRKSGCPEILALGRGIVVGEDGKGDDDASTLGKGFETSTVAALMPLNGSPCPQSARVPLALPQSWEPAAPFRRTDGGVDRLMALSTLSSAGVLRVFDFGMDDKSAHEITPTHSSAPLDASWAQSAAYVVRGPNGDRLFFSRVVLDPSQQSLMTSPQSAPEYLYLEFRYFEAADNQGWREIGNASCRVDLVAQQALEPNNSLPYKLYMRLATESVADPKGTSARDLFSRLYRKELVKLWIETQVIPGYVFNRDHSADHPLDVAIVFHEAADYSVLLKGKISAGSIPYGLGVAWPRERFGFISCS